MSHGVMPQFITSGRHCQRSKRFSLRKREGLEINVLCRNQDQANRFDAFLSPGHPDSLVAVSVK